MVTGVGEVIRDILVLAMASAALSITLTRASVFEVPRGYVAKRSTFFGTLFSCTYCMSHWTSLILTYNFFTGSLVTMLTITFVMVFVVKVYTTIIDFIIAITGEGRGRTEHPAPQGSMPRVLPQKRHAQAGARRMPAQKGL